MVNFRLFSILISYLLFHQCCTAQLEMYFKGNLMDYSIRIICYNDPLSKPYVFGTGFIIRKSNEYFLVTAAHNFRKDSTKAFRFVTPSKANSFQKMLITKMDGVDTEHLQRLVDTVKNRIFYKFYPLNNNQAIDLAVLKLNNPDSYLREHSFHYEDLDSALNYENAIGLTAGYNCFKERMHWFHGPISMTPTPHPYCVFHIISDTATAGMSGSPIYYSYPGKSKLSIVGIFVAEDNSNFPGNGKTGGYGVFAYYIREVIKNYNRNLIR